MATDLYTRRGTPWDDTALADEWSVFCSEIRRNPNAEWEYKSIDRWVAHVAVAMPVGTIFFRARRGFEIVNKNRCPWSGAAIGAPPKCKPGRVNRKGQRVLYCADQEATAISEIRPWRGAYVSVCRAKTSKVLHIVDLSKPIAWPNPFLDHDLRYKLDVAGILKTFAEQLSHPLARDDDEKHDYVPCQYLSDRIRGARFDGIRYLSALGREGTNVALFEPTSAEILDSSLAVVTDLNVEYEF